VLLHQLGWPKHTFVVALSQPATQKPALSIMEPS
jgi:hypothetical protein